MSKAKESPTKRKAKQQKDKNRAGEDVVFMNIPRDRAGAFFSVFTVLDETGVDESGSNDKNNSQPKDKNLKGYLTEREAMLWFRALGWVWTDDQLRDVLRREMTPIKVSKSDSASKETLSVNAYSASALIRLADAHYKERFDPMATGSCEEILRNFEVFDKFISVDKDGHKNIMRADLYRILDGRTDEERKDDKAAPMASPDDINHMLEELGHRSSTLSFNINDLSSKILEKFTEDLATLEDGGE